MMSDNSSRPRRTRRVPENSILFKWVVPAVLLLFALLLLVIVAFSVGVLAGIIPYH